MLKGNGFPIPTSGDQRHEWGVNLQAKWKGLRFFGQWVEQDLAGASGASSALDFGAYFAGFSALLIMSALLVAAAFVRFLFETRSRELGVLRMCGWNAADVRRLCITEERK